jgi:predicted metal-dependent phosphoesterase TrpH
VEPKYDLHCHSTVSDGTLTPTELVDRACRNGVSVLALTDHDSTDGLAEAEAAASGRPIRLLGGVEISVSWRGKTLHIVGLNVNPLEPGLAAGLLQIRNSRLERGERIAAELAKLGIKGSFDAALSYAKNPLTLGRTHFARFLVDAGYAQDTKSVFHRFLGQGKPGYVPHEWASLELAVSWIVASGGIAVIAHPGRYGLSRDQVVQLLGEFREFGGRAIEVLTGSHPAEQSRLFADYSRSSGLAASCGSDFHGPGESRVDLGGLPHLPLDLKPVWESLGH